MLKARLENHQQYASRESHSRKGVIDVVVLMMEMQIVQHAQEEVVVGVRIKIYLRAVCLAVNDKTSTCKTILNIDIYHSSISEFDPSISYPLCLR